MNLKIFLFSIFIFSIFSSAYTTIFNLYLELGGLRFSTIGGILFMSGVGASIIAFPTGFLSDRVGRKRFLSISTFFIPLTLLLQSITINPQALALISFAYGVLSLIYRISINPYIAENSSRDVRVQLFSFSFILTNSATFIGNFISGRVGIVFNSTVFLSLRYSLILFSILLIIPFFFIIRLKENSIKENDFVYNNGNPQDYAIAMRFAAKNALIGFGAGITIPFLNLYFKNTFGLSPATIGTIFSVDVLFMTFFGLFGPRLSTKMNLTKSIIFYELLSIPFLLILAFHVSLPAALICAWLRGGLMNASSPLLSTLQMELVSQRRRGTVSAILLVVDNLFRAIGALIGGALIEHTGFSLNFILTAVTYLISVILFYHFFKNKDAYRVEKL